MQPFSLSLSLGLTDCPLTACRAIDPFFAMGIGIAAAGVRINREEKEKGKSTQQSWESLQRRWAIAMERDESSAAPKGTDDVQAKKR